jgi:hypothetical protein
VPDWIQKEMKTMKRSGVIALLSVLALGISGFSALAANNSEETTFLAMKQDGGWMGYTTDNAMDLALPSYLYSTLFPMYQGPVQGQKLTVCNSTKSSGCADPANSLWFHSNFINCTSSLDTDCIERFGIVNSDQSITDATFVKEYQQSGNFPADPSIKLPAGHGQNIWSISDSSGVHLYALQVGVDGTFLKTDSAVKVSSFSSSVQPVQEVTGSQYLDPTPRVMTRTYGDGWGIENTSILLGCDIYMTNLCAMRQAFDLTQTFILKVRLQNSVTGWLHGRMKDANITMETGANGGQIVTIQARPLQVPVLSGWIKWTDLPAAVQARYPVGSGGMTNSLSGFTTSDLNSRTLQVQSQVSGQRALDEVSAWLPLLGNKASNMKTFWTVKTISGQLPFDLSKCPNATGVTGFIGTNASVYSDGPPSYDSSTGSLNYTVAAPHFDSSGNVFGGVYQLSVRSDVARCIYNFNNAPISAKIEIASADGTQRVATTTVSEKAGWLNLVASGFEFSSPTIKVKLSQDAPAPAPVATPTPVATPEPTPSAAPTTPPVAPAPQPTVAAKKITITCVKGKTTKTVTAVKPVCPTGYKKK